MGIRIDTSQADPTLFAAPAAPQPSGTDQDDSTQATDDTTATGDTVEITGNETDELRPAGVEETEPTNEPQDDTGGVNLPGENLDLVA